MIRKDLETGEIDGELAMLHMQVSTIQINSLATLIQSQHCIHILELNYSNNFDDYCVTVLANVLACNKYLTHFELRGCNISFNRLLTNAKMLQTNNVLIMLALNDNDFNSDDLDCPSRNDS